MEIVLFDASFIPQAGGLLARRHHRDRQRMHLLPARWEDPSAAEQAVSILFAKPGVTGVAAMDGSKVLGYMLAEPVLDEQWGRSAWVRLAGCALGEIPPSDLLPDLYSVLYAPLVEQGIFFHFAQVPADDMELNRTWFHLSFGVEQVYAIANLEEVDLTPRPLPPGVEIRTGGPGDRAILEGFSEVISARLAQPPVWGARLPERAVERRESYDDLVDDSKAMIWLAFVNGAAAGLIVFFPSEPGQDDLLTPEDSTDLAVASVHPAYRRMGVMQALTRCSLAHARQEGYRRSLTDWRSANLESARFWPRWGFRPAVNRLVRRVDMRIAWAK